MDKEKLSEKLNDFFGDKTIKVIMPKQFLANLSDILTKQNYEFKKLLSENKTDLQPILHEIKDDRELIDKLYKAVKEIKIPEAREIKLPEYPKEIEIKKPSWYEKFIPDKILEYIEKGFKQIKFDKELLYMPFYVNSSRTIINGIPDKIIKIYAIKLVVSEDMSVNWNDGGLIDLEGSQSYIRNGGYVESVNWPYYLFSVSAGNNLDLIINSGKNGIAAGRLSYWFDDAK